MTGETQVLVLEDEPLIAMDLEDLLAGRGYTVVGPFSTADAALESLKTAQPATALLDVYLFNGTSFGVARELKRRGIPFAFMTGLVASDLLPDDLAGSPIILKPYREKELLSFVAN
jgi:DNA-binding response OmpR family regulator